MPELEEFREELGDCMENLLPEGSDRPDEEDHLYHYTSASNLRRIVRDGRICLTNLLFMNDRTELSFAWEKLIEQIDERKQVDDRPIARQFLNDLERASKPSENQILEDYDVYAFCLSSDGDSLTMWRNYARDASGCALGFDGDALFSLTNDSEDVKIELMEVSYDDEELEDHLYTLLQNVSARLSDVAQETPEGDWDGFVQRAIRFTMRTVAHLAPRYKNPAFEGEDEWRLLLFWSPFYWNVDGNPVEFRATDSMILPFVPIPNEPLDLNFQDGLPLRRVTVGPLSEATIARRGYEAFLRRQGYADVAVDESEAPVRF